MLHAPTCRTVPMDTAARTPPSQALPRYVAAQLTQAIALLGRERGHLHRGIHQGRKCIRRSRAALALAADALGPAGAALDAQLRTINRSLSAARDAQALVEAVARLEDQAQGEKRRKLLHRARRRAAKARAPALRAVLAADPGFARLRRQLFDLQTAIAGLPWRELSEEIIEDALAASAAQVRRAARKAAKRGDDEHWHRWRRRARRLSQQRGLLGELGWRLPKDRDKAVALVLGEQQDYSLLLAHCGDASPFKPGDRAELRALAQAKLHKLRRRLAKSVAR
ncbi:CHAD domain-containing protein [Xanthomonas sp. AmX2]|uniref:CHAD domain-containing protein n=1 Tax=Xanthomonas sp. TaxID=29446 RepID=UPI001981FF3F|nr:CHAD domain-containing protein [Xanthomonas sp.]MBN6152239.1 CHAD domain-containing protein [Xanthomonas sp.]